MANYIDAHNDGMYQMAKMLKQQFDTCVELRQVMETTDWNLLAKQKQALLDLPFINKETEYLVEGLIAWIDSVQDSVVLDKLATELQVFGDTP